MPDDEKLLKCSCKECGNHLASAPSMVNTVIPCPDCGQGTELSSDSQAGPGEPRGQKVGLTRFAFVLFLVVTLTAGLIFIKSKMGETGTKTQKVTMAPTNA